MFRLVAFMMLYASAVAAAEPPRLPLKRVVLVNSGLAFFEHAGTVNGNEQIELPIAGEGINDVLKSLVVQDLDNGFVTAIQYDSPQPVNDALRELSVDLSHNPTLAQIFHQLRGQPVELTIARQEQPVKGPIVGVELTANFLPRDEPIAEDVVNIRTPDGMRSVRIEAIELTRFTNEQTDREFQDALALLSKSRQHDRKIIRLEFHGEGRRPVALAMYRPPGVEDQLSPGAG